MNMDNLKALTKESTPKAAVNLSASDIAFLVDCLPEKDDKLRYNAFLLLQANARLFPLVYQHWDKLAGRLEDSNSYQRSIGAMLISENVKWDKEAKFTQEIDRYLSCCVDENSLRQEKRFRGL